MSKSITGAHAVIQALRQEGVKYVFGLPGTTIMHLLDELAKQEEIRYISVRHEQVAAFMADGYARGSGELGVCMASRGPGAANMTIGMHNAYAESVPVLALLGQVSDEIYYRDAFEEMDLVKFYEPVTKWSTEIHRPERIPELVQRAVRTALSGRARPVMVSLPLDIQTSQISNSKLQPQFRLEHPVPPIIKIEEAVQLLTESSRPVILLGGGSVTTGCHSLIAQLAESICAPVITSWVRKDAFPNDHPLFFGSLGYGACAVTEKLVREADVILSVGCHFSEFTTKRWTLLSPATKLIQIDIDHDEIGKVYIPEIGLLGDARQTVQLMRDIVSNYLHNEESRNVRSNRLQQLQPIYQQEISLPVSLTSSPVPSQAIIHALQQVIDHHSGTIVMDAPTFGVWAQKYLLIRRPNSFYSPAGGSMGWGLPAALGIQLSRPNERVIAVLGDGTFWMVAQDLETAVRENIPVVVVITNNFAFGNTRDRQKTAHDGRYFGVFYNNMDFAQFAQLLGAYGERVERSEALLPAIERALVSGKPAVIDVIQDRHEGLPEGIVPPNFK